MRLPWACAILLFLLLPCAALAAGSPPPPFAAADTPELENPGFECSGGYHPQEGIQGMVPDGWHAAVLSEANPFICSVQFWASMGSSCVEADNGFEKLEGYDSFIIMGDWAKYGDDFYAPPFDVTIYQQVTVTVGTAYSVSGWMTSLCGGSATPSDCPDGAYIAKMLGIDPAGGTDPRGASVQWYEDRRPHTESRWADLRLGATAQAMTMTIFMRVNSPFGHHGNMAFADAVKLVQAPRAWLAGLPQQSDSRTFTVAWDGDLGPDIPQIDNQNYRLTYDVQYRVGADGAWQDWQMDQPAGSATFLAEAPGTDVRYYFRARSRAEQPDGERGASPNHRFPGDWGAPQEVRVSWQYPGPPVTFVPFLQK